MAEVHACPGCGTEMLTAYWLCNLCADAIPDPLIVEIGTALDDGRDVDAAYGINQAADLIEQE